MRLSLVPLALALLAAAACTLAPTGPQGDRSAEHAAATRAVAAWAERHAQGWSLEASGARPLARPEWSPPCAAAPPGGFVVLRFQAAATEIDLHFRCPLGASAGVAELRAAFSHVALNRLPHGIASPGWEFEVLTPSSSFGEGVAFEAAGAGELLVTLRTPLYAVYGHSVRAGCQPPADAPSEPGCFLMREHRVPLSARLRASLDPAALR